MMMMMMMRVNVLFILVPTAFQGILLFLNACPSICFLLFLSFSRISSVFYISPGTGSCRSPSPCEAAAYLQLKVLITF